MERRTLREAWQNCDRYKLREGRPLSAILSSLTAFLDAGMRPRTPLAKAIALVLVIKLIGIAGLTIFIFSDDAHQSIDAAAMVRVMGLSTSPP
jgi:hypothetical protein